MGDPCFVLCGNDPLESMHITYFLAPGFKPGAFLRPGQVQQLHSADLIAVQAEVIAPVEQVHDDLGFPAVGGITSKITPGRRREIG